MITTFLRIEVSSKPIPGKEHAGIHNSVEESNGSVEGDFEGLRVRTKRKSMIIIYPFFSGRGLIVKAASDNRDGSGNSVDGVSFRIHKRSPINLGGAPKGAMIYKLGKLLTPTGIFTPSGLLYKLAGKMFKLPWPLGPIWG